MSGVETAVIVMELAKTALEFVQFVRRVSAKYKQNPGDFRELKEISDDLELLFVEYNDVLARAFAYAPVGQKGKPLPLERLDDAIELVQEKVEEFDKMSPFLRLGRCLKLSDELDKLCGRLIRVKSTVMDGVNLHTNKAVIEMLKRMEKMLQRVEQGDARIAKEACEREKEQNRVGISQVPEMRRRLYDRHRFPEDEPISVTADVLKELEALLGLPEFAELKAFVGSDVEMLAKNLVCVGHGRYVANMEQARCSNEAPALTDIMDAFTPRSPPTPSPDPAGHLDLVLAIDGELRDKAPDEAVELLLSRLRGEGARVDSGASCQLPPEWRVAALKLCEFCSAAHSPFKEIEAKYQHANRTGMPLHLLWDPQVEAQLQLAGR